MTDTIRDAVARAIYGAAFDAPGRSSPSPGWCWERCGEAQREFCRRQADAAIAAHLSALEAQGYVVMRRINSHSIEVRKIAAPRQERAGSDDQECPGIDTTNPGASTSA